jgi:antirestriction protein
MHTPPDLDTMRNSDMLDSRDVIARIEELGCCPDLNTSEEDAELATLQAFAEEAEGYAQDWSFGESLIRDSYFEDYARELADDIGAIDSDAGWPTACIDWEQAASDLQMDYTSVELDGVTFWTR